MAYFLLMLSLVYNTYKFVIKQERYKFFHIVIFYVLSYLIVLLRVTWFILIWCDIKME